jgi:hypothetical protein
MSPRTSLLAALALAPFASATSNSSTDSLSAALDSLTQAQADQSTRVGVLLRAAYDVIEDELSATTDDLSGMRLYDAQIWVSSRMGAYEVFIKADAGETNAFPPVTGDGVTSFDLRDAYVRTDIVDGVQLWWGQYKCPFLASSAVGEGRLSFIDRTRLGELFGSAPAYQPGVAVTGDWDAIHLKVSVQNGADGTSDEHGIVLRGEYMIGEGAKHHEGAYGSAGGLNATVGLGYFKDDGDVGGMEFGKAWGVDAYVTSDNLSFHAEIVDMDEELAINTLGNTTDDATPWSATVGYLLPDQPWEVLARYQDLDTETDATLIGGGVNYFVNGHATKWQLNLSQYDDDNIDGTILQLGLVVGLDGPY